MKRNFIQIALASALAFITLPAFAFNLFGLNKDADIQQMLEFVPADSPLFMGGIVNPEMLSASDGLYTEAFIAQSKSDLDDLTEVLGDSPNMQFLFEFYQVYLETLREGGVAFYHRFGLDTKGASAFYLDGVFPVIRLSLKDEGQFLATLNQIATQAHVKLELQAIGDATIQTLTLVDSDEAKLNLGFSTANKTVTLSFFNQDETEAALQTRFALVQPAQVYGKASWKALGKDYQFDRELRGFIDFPKLVNSLSEGKGRAADQLASMGAPRVIAETCQADIENLANAVPLWAFGSSGSTYGEQSMTTKLTSHLVLANTELVAELSKLRGFIPAYVLDPELTVGLGVGLDLNALVPSLTALWQQFNSLEFSCEELSDLQSQVSELNPAMLGVVTGLANGVTGIGAGLFEFSGNLFDGSLAIDALISVSAEQPQTLASLASTYLPQLAGQSIPSDGSSLEVSMPMLEQPVQIAIKGQHLTAFIGAQAEATANALMNETIDANGISAIGLNYGKLGQLMLDQGSLLAAQSTESCTELMQNALLLKQWDLHLTAQSDITTEGLFDQLAVNLRKADSSDFNVAGSYDVVYLNEECSWELLGQEVINDDATGLYSETEEGYSCNLYELTYEWQLDGNLLNQVGTEAGYRESCEQPMLEDELYDFDCQILTADDSGFYCLYSEEDGYRELYHYQRLAQ